MAISDDTNTGHGTMKTVFGCAQQSIPQVPAASSTQDLETQIDRVRRRAYLSNKGLKSSGQHQLDLVFADDIGERKDLRHIPNDYGRSSLFTVRNKRMQRKTLMREPLFHYNEHVSILYTGIELRAEDDELVWLQILNYGQSVPLGAPFEFDIKDLVRDVKWAKNGRNYDRARECITRLRANEVLAMNSKAYGKSGTISLIQNYTTANDSDGKPTRYRMCIDPNLIVLFAGHTFTSHTWEIYRDLSPVARRLADYIASHKHPFPLTLSKFQKMCDSSTSDKSSWRQTVKRACAEIVEAKIADVATLNDDDQICCVRE